MDIRGYLEKHHLSQAQFAEKVGVSQGMVWQWLNERTPVSAKQAVNIEDKTAGEIRREHLRPDIFSTRAA